MSTKYISPFTLSRLVKNSKFSMNRATRCDFMREVLENNYIQELKDLQNKQKEDINSLSIGEKIRIIRLKSYKKLSEFQMESDFEYYGDVSRAKEYISKYQSFIVEGLVAKIGQDQFDAEILENDYNYNVEELTVAKYNEIYQENVIDDDDYFDGVYFMDAIKHFNETCVTKEVVALGKKYGIKLPKYWSKQELQDKLIRYYSEKGKLTKKLETEVKAYTLTEVKAKLSEVGISSENHTKKASMIDYIIRTMTRNHIEEEIPQVQIIPEEIQAIMPINDNNENNENYEHYLKEIVRNQEKVIMYLQKMSKNAPQEETQLQRVLTITVFLLIIFVAIMWTIYGVNTFFM